MMAGRMVGSGSSGIGFSLAWIGNVTFLSVFVFTVFYLRQGRVCRFDLGTVLDLRTGLNER